MELKERVKVVPMTSILLYCHFFTAKKHFQLLLVSHFVLDPLGSDVNRACREIVMQMQKNGNPRRLHL